MFIFGALGTLIRVLIEQTWVNETWPAATFTINLTGSFALGVLLGVLSARDVADAKQGRIKLAIGTGLLGGYTTYSTFIIEGEQLAQTSAGVSIAYLLGSVVLGILVAALGMIGGRSVFNGLQRRSQGRGPQ